MITITTSNLNGIRAAERKGMLNWSDAHTPDVWCMQEVRAPQDAIDPITVSYTHLTLPTNREV